jgi:hypothetical protein
MGSIRAASAERAGKDSAADLALAEGLPRQRSGGKARECGGYALGYTAEIAVSEDHLIVAQRVTLNPCDVPALVPLVKEVEERTGASPEKALADAGFYSNQNVRELEARGIDVYVMCPTRKLARELYTGKRARTIGRNRVRSLELKAMRKKLRSRAGRRVYERRKTLVEPVFGVLKQQRGMRQFRTRGSAKVTTEFTLAALAYNLTGCSSAGGHCKADEPGKLERSKSGTGRMPTTNQFSARTEAQLHPKPASPHPAGAMEKSTSDARAYTTINTLGLSTCVL